MRSDVELLLNLQAGVIARRQLVKSKWTDHDIARMLRRREWASVFEGVYVTHTGELTWLQHAWAAVLFSGPAALSHFSALRAMDGPGRRDAVDLPIHVLVERTRRLVEPPGVRIHRRLDYSKQVQWNLSPPRVRCEHAVIDVAAAAADAQARVADQRAA